jgi:hypothetical protein
MSLETSKPVNPCEKNPMVFYQLTRIFCNPGDKVLVMGAGSGAEVCGANRCGVNVVAIEKDPIQFKEIQTRLVEERESAESVKWEMLKKMDHIMSWITAGHRASSHDPGIVTCISCKQETDALGQVEEEPESPARSRPETITASASTSSASPSSSRQRPAVPSASPVNSGTALLTAVSAPKQLVSQLKCIGCDVVFDDGAGKTCANCAAPICPSDDCFFQAADDKNGTASPVLCRENCTA